MLKNYLKIALRNLWKHKGFSFLNIAGLAIGLTAGFLILLYVGFELSYDNFHSKSDRIYRVVSDIETPTGLVHNSEPAWAVPPNMQLEFPEVESAVRIMEMNVLVNNEEQNYNEANSLSADPDFFKMFDFELLSGDKENTLVDPFSIVLSETTAKKYFGNTNPVGKSLKILDDGFLAKVTGVMKDIPENSHIKADMILSMTTFTEDLDKELNNKWDWYDPDAYVLLSPNADSKALATMFPDFLERNDGESMKELNVNVSLFLEPFNDVYLRSYRYRKISGNIDNIYIFSIVAIFILLIACINFINLTTARSVERAKEVGIRKVIGAGKRQLGLQFIGESVIISFIAFFITLLLTILLLPYFNELAGKMVSEGILVVPNHILILLAISLGIGVLAGIYPAFVLSSFKPVSVLKGSFSTGTKGVLLRKGLVIAQFSISIALIIGTIIIYNQMEYMRNQELGFDKEQTLVLSYPKKEIKDAIDNLSGVKSTSLVSSIPGGDNPVAYSKIENLNGDQQILDIDLYFVDFDAISQFDMKIIEGRSFSRDFPTDSTEAMVINETAVKLLGYQSAGDALGAKFEQWGRKGKVIGVVQDFHFKSLKENIKPLTLRIEPNRTGLLTVKLAPQDIVKTVASIEEKWKTIVPSEPFDYYFLDEFFDRQYRTEERFGNLFLNFAALAILISCLGLLGLAAYSTLQRNKEIGIRKVLGSSVMGVVGLLSADFLKLVGIAFLIASPLAWMAMNSWLKDFAYRIDIQWWMFALAGTSALLIAFLTVSFHAIKAGSANPIKSLRTE
jgi:putative ABC transport system permease protein